MIEMFEVGGCVRDEMLGVASKDIDFAVEASSFESMRTYLNVNGFTIFLETPEFFTIRARFPAFKGYRGGRTGQTADFVLCRRDGAYSDGRRPDAVEPGTIFDDLARRDFTVNAMAKASDGSLIDPHGGREDLERKILRAVGDPEVRLKEDSLRALRAIRFAVTKGFTFDESLAEALRAEWLPAALTSVSAERKREELDKAFREDTIKTIALLTSLGWSFQEAVLDGGIWLRPTLEQK